MAAKSRTLLERESRRNESEIRVEILRALLTNGPLVPTRIMLKVNTNWYYVMRSLDRLLTTGALAKTKRTRIQSLHWVWTRSAGTTRSWKFSDSMKSISPGERIAE